MHVNSVRIRIRTRERERERRLINNVARGSRTITSCQRGERASMTQLACAHMRGSCAQKTMRRKKKMNCARARERERERGRADNEVYTYTLLHCARVDNGDLYFIWQIIFY